MIGTSCKFESRIADKTGSIWASRMQYHVLQAAGGLTTSVLALILNAQADEETVELEYFEPSLEPFDNSNSTTIVADSIAALSIFGAAGYCARRRLG
jgi:hypothetical protein